MNSIINSILSFGTLVKFKISSYKVYIIKFEDMELYYINGDNVYVKNIDNETINVVKLNELQFSHLKNNLTK